MARIFTEFADKEEQPSRLDREIARDIQRHPDGDFSEVLRQSDSWEKLFHLSLLRVALLGWYDFPSDADILEVGAGFGALTGYLAEQGRSVTAIEPSLFRARALARRYANRDKITVYAGKLARISLPGRFDYIVAAGVLETESDRAACLARLRGLLRPGGRLLLAADNRYGLKYFCGEQDPYSRLPFGGIHGLPAAGRGFSRQELDGLLRAAGFPARKFYYPLPDYRLPQVIYSERHLPGRELLERDTPYYLSKGTLVASEHALYADILANGAFEFFANSFLVECGEGTVCPVDYAVVTADRGRTGSLVTCRRGNVSFSKRALYPEGATAMERLQENMEQLAARGIGVIPYEFRVGQMQMPCIGEPTLADYLRSLRPGDKEAVWAVFDHLWQLILQSSEMVSAAGNILLPRAPVADWGPVLQRAYLEMIPMNCFLLNKQFAFFDQEFVWDNCPAKYPMFRALVYCEEYLGPVVSEEELRERYGLAELWPVLQQVEEEFHQRLRRKDIYHQFYAWAWADMDRIQQNIARLAGGQGAKISLESALAGRSYELYSFDVFDTLITRQTGTPKGIFALVQQRLQGAGYEDFPSRVRKYFYELRCYYERRASREICQGDVGDITMAEIYHVFGRQEHLSDGQTRQLLELECQVECEHVLGIAENIRIVKQLCSEGRRVVLISNMYMEEPMLRRLLQQAAPVLAGLPVYVSSAYRQRKETGRLFAAVQTAERVDVLDWVHCGDNPVADIQVPERLGICTIAYRESALTAEERQLLQGHEADAERQLLVGKVKNLRFAAGNEALAVVAENGMSAGFPWQVLPDTVAVYGAGRFGRDLYQQLQVQSKRVSCWVDRDYARLQAEGLPVEAPAALQTAAYDMVVIALKDMARVEAVRAVLQQQGIPAEKIF